MTRRSRIGSHQLQQLAQTLTQLDWQILTEIGKFRLATTRQVQRLHFGPSSGDERRCQRNLARLAELGVIDQLPRRVGGRSRGSDSAAHRTGRVGRRLLQLSGGAGRSWQPSAAFTAHTLGVVDTYVELVEQTRTGAVDLAEFTPEPGAWRNFTHKMQPVTLKPDAFAIVNVDGVERHYFIELDLGTESMTIIENKISRYLGYYRSGPALAVFPQVLFLVDSKASYHARGTVERVEQIEVAAANVLPESLSQLVAVCAKDHPPWASAQAA